jgi:hypothetical protein
VSEIENTFGQPKPPRFSVRVSFVDSHNKLYCSDEADFDVPNGASLEDVALEHLKCLGIGLREEIRRQRSLGAEL